MRIRTSDIRTSVRAWRCYNTISSTQPYSWTLYTSSKKVNLNYKQVTDVGRRRIPARPRKVIYLRPNPWTRKHYEGRAEYSVNKGVDFYLQNDRDTVICKSRVLNNSWYASIRGNPCGALLGDTQLDLLPEELWNDIEARGAYNAALANQRNPPNIDGWTWLVELKETVDMLKHPLKSLASASAFYGMRRRKPRRPGKHPRKSKKRKTVPRVGTVPINTAAGLWLEYTFGWMSLSKQIDDACKEFAEAWARRPLKINRSKGSFDVQADYSVVMVRKQMGEFSLLFKVETSVKRSYESIVYGNDMLLRVPTYGTSTDRILPALWEIVPLSFVADWFVGIGTWLDSIQMIPGTKVYASTSNLWTVKTRTVELSSVSFTYGGITTPCEILVPCKLTQVLDYKDRHVNAFEGLGFPVPRPWMLSLEKKLTSTALIWRRLPDIFKKKGRT